MSKARRKRVGGPLEAHGDNGTAAGLWINLVMHSDISEIVLTGSEEHIMLEEGLLG